MSKTLNINGRDVETDAGEDTPLLWILREHLGLVGTKFGCGAGLCGACMVHIDGTRAFACQTLLSELDGGRHILTIEGLSAAGDHPVQRAWVEEQAPQCGYCQPGQIMSAVDLLSRIPDPSREEIVEHMSANICRCGAYPAIIRAIERAAKLMRKGQTAG